VEPFRQIAFYLLLWRAILIALLALVTAATSCLELQRALLAGAVVALLFSIGLIVWSELLGSERIVRTSAWRALQANQRQAGPAGRAVACRCLRGLALHFAKASSAAAAALSVSALLLRST